MNGFFDNLATNIHTMESRNLLPNQMRLLGESEYRPRTDPYSSSAAFINSVSFCPVLLGRVSGAMLDVSLLVNEVQNSNYDTLSTN